MATDLQGFTTQEVLNKVLNTTSESFKVDIVSGSEYAEDSSHTDADTGQFILGVRNDTLAALGGTDGDYVPFQMNSDGALYVEISSGGGEDAVYADDADWTDGSSKHMLVGGLYQSSPQSITDGDVGPFQVDADGALHISDGGNAITVDGTVTANAGTNLNTSALSTHAKQDTMITHLGEIEGAVETIETTVGTDGSAGPAKTLSVGGTESGGNIQELRVDSDGHLQVDVLSAASTAVTNAGTFAVQVDGSALTALQLIDDTVATLGTTTYTETSTKGNVVGAVRNDTLAALAGTDNEIAPLQVNKSGALYTAEETGQLGAIYESGTTVVSGEQIIAIQFLEDTKFTTLTPASAAFIGTASGDGDNIVNTEVFPQGMTIFGRWTAFTLVTGGRVIAYKGVW